MFGEYPDCMPDVSQLSNISYFRSQSLRCVCWQSAGKQWVHPSESLTTGRVVYTVKVTVNTVSCYKTINSKHGLSLPDWERVSMELHHPLYFIYLLSSVFFPSVHNELKLEYTFNNHLHLLIVIPDNVISYFYF